MLSTKSFRAILSLGLVLFVIGCIQVTGVATPTLAPSLIPSQTPFLPSLPSPTPGVPPVQDTSVPTGIVTSPIGQPIAAHRGEVQGLAFTPDGKTLVSESHAQAGMAIELWDIATGKSIASFTDSNRLFSAISLSQDGRLLAYGRCGKYDTSTSPCREYEIVLWNMTTHQFSGQPISFPYKGPLAHSEVDLSPDGRIVAHMFSGDTGSGIVQVFDVATRQLIATPLGGEIQLTGMAFSPDSKYIALGSITGVIYRWNVETNSVSTTLTGERGFVTNLTFSPDGEILASKVLIPATEPTKKIVLWDMITGQPIGQPLTIGPAPHLDHYSNTAFSPNLETLALIDKNETITLWNTQTGQPIGQPFMGQSAEGGAAITTCLAFSPDGKTLASGTEDGTINLWNITTGSLNP